MRPTPLAPQRKKRFRRPLLAGLLAVLAGGIVGGAVLARQALRAAPPIASSSSGSTTAWEPRWTPGFRYTYSFAWSGDTHAHLGGASAEAAYDVAGRLEVRAAAAGGGTVLELSLSDVTRHTLRAFGIDTVRGDDDARTLLETPRAWADVGPKGVIKRVRFAVDAPKPFEGLMTKLVEQMQATGPATPSSEWTASEPGPNGRADARYVSDGLQATRKRERYTSLDSAPNGCAGCTQEIGDRAEVRFDLRGVVAKLEDAETLRVLDHGSETLRAVNRFSILCESISAFDTPVEPPQVADVRELGAPASLSAADERAILEANAKGFDPALLDAYIDQFAKDGQIPADKTWMVHGRAYLRLHPEALEPLARRLASPSLNTRGRDMVLQVLAVAGSPRAQEIMRASLATLRGKESLPEYVQLQQKLSFVDHPTSETRDWVENAYQTAHARGEADVALASAVTLGNLARKLAKGDDPDASRRVVSELEADLSHAGGAHERAGLVLALHAAGDGNSPEVRALANDASTAVRGEVARALSGVATPDARSTLLGMARDGDIGVAGAALVALDADQPTPDDIHALATSILGGQTPRGVDAGLMAFFADHMDAPDASAVLNSILERTNDPALARRVRTLLGQPPS